MFRVFILCIRDLYFMYEINDNNNIAIYRVYRLYVLNVYEKYMIIAR